MHGSHAWSSLQLPYLDLLRPLTTYMDRALHDLSIGLHGYRQLLLAILSITYQVPPKSSYQLPADQIAGVLYGFHEGFPSRWSDILSLVTGHGHRILDLTL
jgi:hypothetical protein